MTYNDYVKALITGNYRKVVRLEFLQPDNSIAFILGNAIKRGYQKQHDTRTFIQDGTLNVSMQNGIRRKATVKLANLDSVYSYNINRIWYGDKIRLMMGVEISSGEEYVFPQGVFVIENPQEAYKPSEKTVTYQLVDKWANINGEHGGTFDTTYIIPTTTGGINTNIFFAMQSLLQLSRFTFEYDGNTNNMIDNVLPLFTDYYNDKVYINNLTDEIENYTDLPYEIAIDGLNGTVADALLELNTALSGLIGYDATGALKVEPSQENITDSTKQILWTFDSGDNLLTSISETAKNIDVKNDVIISGTNLNNVEIWGRASNYDLRSDTNINVIGRRTYRESKSTYWSTEQCASLAAYELKKRCILQKSVCFECAPLYHLYENGVIRSRREDKDGSPLENHLISSYSIPLSEQGTMQINATSINDIPNFDITTSAANTNI